MEKYFEKHSLLSKYQSGFRKRYSCETAINYVINRWKFIGNDGKVLAIFLDFETINKDILVKQLSCYGIKDKELKCFSSYLTRRRHITKVNGVESSIRENYFGVPQGSIFVENVVEKCEIVLYADDALIFTECATCEECYERIGKDMDNIKV